jgi:hypothetical protein
LKEEALDRSMWRARFGRDFGPVVRQTTKWVNESPLYHLCVHMYFHLFIPHPRATFLTLILPVVFISCLLMSHFYLSDFCIDFISYLLAVLLFVLVPRNIIDLRCSNPIPLYRVL